MHRFFAEIDFGAGVLKEPALVSQIKNVLRLSKGDRIVLFDNSGSEHLVKLDSVGKKGVEFHLIEKRDGVGFLRDITLYQAILKKDNFELVVQKATELGVRRIVPLLTERCVKRELSKQQLHRLHRIVVEATEQSEGSILPEITGILDFEEAVAELAESDLNLLAYAREGNKTLEGLDLDNRISVFIGPEGGFSDNEVKRAADRGIITVSLGKRIYRAETAAIALLGRLIIE